MKKRKFLRLLLAVFTAMMMLPLVTVAQDDNHYLKIEASDMVEHVWDNQFWLSFPNNPAQDGDRWVLSMKIRADKHATVNTEVHNSPADHINEDFPNIEFPEYWTTITESGWFSSSSSSPIKSIAFTLNSYFSEANTYYFDDISLKINGVEVIKNGNCEGKDFSNFVYKYDRGEQQYVERAYTDESLYPTSLDLSNISTEIIQGEQLRGRIIATMKDGSIDYIPIRKATTTLDNNIVGKQIITVSYRGKSAQMTVNVKKNKFLKINTTSKVDESWDNQFWIVFKDYPCKGGEDWELTMKIRADKAATISAQLHADPSEYLTWQFLDDKVLFQTTWTTITQTGTFLTSDKWDYNNDKFIKSIAFNLNDYASANTYYFDDISLKINGVEVIKNGDLEGYDFSNFAYKYNKGAIQDVEKASSLVVPYARLSADGTVTFYYDDNPSEDDFSIEDGGLSKYQKKNFKKVVFDMSFRNYQPTSCAKWFSGCYNLTEIVGMRNYLNTAKVTDMSSMFSGCSSLTSLDVSNFNTANVTNMSSMFYNCSSLTNLDVSNFNTERVSNVSSMFYGCRNLTSLDLSNFAFKYLFYAKEMFAGCSKLNVIYVSNNWTFLENPFDNGMFNRCYRLHGGQGTTVDESVYYQSQYAKIDGGAKDPGIFTKSGDKPFVTTKTYAYAVLKDSTLTFYYANSIPKDAYDIDAYEMNSYTLRKSNIKKVVFDKSFRDYKPTSCARWFSGCSNLTEIVGMKEYLNTENVTDMSYMFDGCSSLANLDLSGFKTANVTNMERMFYYCSSLTNLDLSGFNTANVTNMERMFSNCKEIKTVYASEKWSLNKELSSGEMFNYCYKLYGGMGSCISDFSSIDATYAKIDGGSKTPGYFTKSGDKPFVATGAYAILKDSTLTFYYTNNTIPEGAYDIKARDYSYRGAGVKKVVFDKSFAVYKPANCEDWFSGCSNLTEIVGMKEYLNTENVRDMSYMFSSCSSLTSLDLSGFNTKNLTDISGMFSGCSNLETIFVSEKWDTTKVTYSNYMFNYCTKLYGGAGTIYTKSHTNGQYAHIDGGEKDPGYLTKAGEKKTKIISIRVSKLPTKQEYILGDYKLELGGGEITVNFSNNTKQTQLLEYAEVTGFNPIAVGKQSLTVNYLGKTATYDIKMVDSGINTYTILNKADSTLTLFYGNYRAGAMRGISVPDSLRSAVKIAIIDPSYKNFKPEKTDSMFYYYKNMTNIIGLEFLNTENVTSMSHMFRECWRLTSLDLSNFNTSNVTNMDYMFNACISLSKIYVGDSWSIPGIYCNHMFDVCRNLVGGKGTICDIEYSDEDLKYAHIDEGIRNPGYLTMMLDVTSISISKLPYKTEYAEGQAIDLSGGEIIATFSDYSATIINMSYVSVTGYNANKLGTQYLTIEYKGQKAEFKVNVVVKSAISIMLTTPVAKTQYSKGEALSFEGGVITVKYDNGTYDEIPLSKASVSGYDANKTGEQTVTVEYLGLITTFKVTVSPSTPVSEIDPANDINIWSFEKTIYVQNPGNDIRIADISGRLIMTIKANSDRMEIPMQKAGIYIVKTGVKTQKVIIQ